MSNIKKIQPKQLNTLLSKSVTTVVDVREPYDFAEQRIPQAISMPESNFSQHVKHLAHETREVIFVCENGKHSATCAKRAHTQFGDRVAIYVLTGGMSAWEKAGFPVASDAYDEFDGMPIYQQIFIGAGALSALFSLITIITWKALALFPLAIAVGLIFLGVTGNKDLEGFIMTLPWNKNKDN